MYKNVDASHRGGAWKIGEMFRNEKDPGTCMVLLMGIKTWFTRDAALGPETGEETAEKKGEK